MLKVTAESFIRNTTLCAELATFFPEAVLWDKSTSLEEFCADAEALIVGREKITEQFLEACPALKIISKYGVGLDNIDLDACKKRAIKIGWTPGVNKTSVAELTLAFMLGSAHNVFYTGTELKKGNWNKSGGLNFSGKTVGIIGVGNVGKELVRMLQPFGCHIMINDIVAQPAYYTENNLQISSKGEIYTQADFISLHVPLTKETQHMIGRHELSTMKKNAVLINTSRGEVVNQKDLKNALSQHIIGGACVDVFAIEPCTDEELLTLPNFFSTPHIGGNSIESVLAMGRSAISHISEYYNKKENPTP